MATNNWRKYFETRIGNKADNKNTEFYSMAWNQAGTNNTKLTLLTNDPSTAAFIVDTSNKQTFPQCIKKTAPKSPMHSKTPVSPAPLSIPQAPEIGVAENILGEYNTCTNAHTYPLNKTESKSLSKQVHFCNTPQIIIMTHPITTTVVHTDKSNPTVGPLRPSKVTVVHADKSTHSWFPLTIPWLPTRHSRDT